MTKAFVRTKNVILDEPTKRYLATKKPSTAETYRANLKRFQVFYGKPLGAFLLEIEEWRDKNREIPITERRNYAEDTIRDYLEWMKKKGYASNPIRGNFTAIQNFLKYYQIAITASFIELPHPVSKKTNKKYEWTTEDLKKFVEAAPTYRDKALIMTMFQSGLAANEICKLNYEDIEKELNSGKLPLLIKTIREKNGVRFKTLLGADAVNYLKLYLSTRSNLGPDSPLFTKWASEDRMKIEAIDRRFRQIAKGLDFVEVKDHEMSPVRPHSLRSGFRSRLTGKADPDLMKSWMGDELGAKSRAYLNLPDEEHRELYANVEKYLSIETTSREVLEGKPQGESIYLSDEYISRLSELEQNNQTLRNWIDEISRELQKTKSEQEEREGKYENRATDLKRRLEELERLVRER